MRQVMVPAEGQRDPWGDCSYWNQLKSVSPFHKVAGTGIIAGIWTGRPTVCTYGKTGYSQA